MEPISIQINCETILKEFICSICLTNLEETYITKCGHSFCKSCIFEAVNRQHKCPQCQAYLEEKDLFKNFTFNSIKSSDFSDFFCTNPLKDLILEQKEKNFKEYFQKIFKKNFSIEKNPALLEIEKDVKSYLEGLLMPYQQKYFETVEEFKTKQMSKKKAKNPEEQQKMKKNLAQIQEFFFESLENQLKSMAIFPLDLPLIIDVFVPIKSIEIKGIMLENLKFDDFLTKLLQKSKESNESIIDANRSTVNIITISFFHREEVKFYIENVKEPSILRESLLNIKGSNEYVLSKDPAFDGKRVENGDVFIVFGQFKFKSDVQPECITYDFKPNAQWNYYSCENCKIKCSTIIFFFIWMIWD